MTDLSSISLTSWAGITAGFALLAGLWRYVQMGLKWVCDLFICRVIVKDEAAKALMSHAWKHGRKSPFGLRLFGGINSFVGPKKRVEIVGYEGVTSEPILFWLGRVPLIIGNTFTGGNNKESPNIGHSSSNATPVTVRFFRGTLNIDELIEQSVTAYNNLRQTRDQSKRAIKRFNVFRMHGSGGYKSENNVATIKEPSGAYASPSSGNSDEIIQQMHHGEVRLITWKPEDLVERSNDSAPFLNHPVAPDLLAQFDEIDVWLKHENWFRSRGLPWYRGFLLYGPTGTGKSTVVRNLAIKYDLPIYSFDLSSYDNRSFAADWKTVQQNAPAIALLEDFDCAFKGRENLVVAGKSRDGLTFDCLLNTISGVGSSDGVLLFVTTNHVETLDPALGIPTINGDGESKSTRPGRINRAVHVGVMGANERRKVAEVICGDWPDVIDALVLLGEGETAAQFQERCAQEAIGRFWEIGVKEEGARVVHGPSDAPHILRRLPVSSLGGGGATPYHMTIEEYTGQ